MEVRILELCNYLPVLVILLSSSNGSKGKVFLFFVTLRHHFGHTPFFLSSFHNSTFINLFFYLYN